MIVALVSYRFLIFVAGVHLFTAGAISFGASQVLNVKEAFVFLPTYGVLLLMSACLVLRNGRWAVDKEHIYKGWPLTPLISIEEIEHAQVGLPPKWTSMLSTAVASAERRALLLRLRGNRWLIWEFWAMVNRDEFVEEILRNAPVEDDIDIPNEVIRRLSLTKVGTILQG
jgi:hypothetical protein